MQNLSKHVMHEATIVTMFFKKDAPDRPSTSGKLACKNTPMILTTVRDILCSFQASAGCMNRSGKYSWKFDTRGSAGTYIQRMLRADFPL
ncbi:hypothetical protein T11_14853 [Trichinella zimbabwensis]|uniref:Uncharacterized protein n=1 Tax=Trichinella zimbabwensis TaxID=268475 RepID=A0A0V1H8U2_9BILA|nr:hypothetical protein T11_14853 [Trichinella zimbabwensis]